MDAPKLGKHAQSAMERIIPLNEEKVTEKYGKHGKVLQRFNHALDCFTNIFRTGKFTQSAQDCVILNKEALKLSKKTEDMSKIDINTLRACQKVFEHIVHAACTLNVDPPRFTKNELKTLNTTASTSWLQNIAKIFEKTEESIRTIEEEDITMQEGNRSLMKLIGEIESETSIEKSDNSRLQIQINNEFKEIREFVNKINTTIENSNDLSLKELKISDNSTNSSNAILQLELDKKIPDFENIKTEINEKALAKLKKYSKQILIHLNNIKELQGSKALSSIESMKKQKTTSHLLSDVLDHNDSDSSDQQ